MYCLKIVVKGQVQGVNFRHHVMIMAQRLDVKGWAKNLENGNLEILACGDEFSVETLLDFCKEGPSMFES